MRFERPAIGGLAVEDELPASDPIVLVTAVGAAEGSRGAAAALACAGAEGEAAPLLVDVGGRPPRPTLLASAAAQRLEERLAAHLPQARIAARGQFCQLAVASGPDGLAAASAAATVARSAPVVVHLEQGGFRDLLDAEIGPRPTGVLLRADVRRDRALLALIAADLTERALVFAVVKHRFGWVTERRALFGALPSDRTGLPTSTLRLMKTISCYGDGGETEADGNGETEARQNGDEAAGGGRAA
jgi:hypothetical protein